MRWLVRWVVACGLCVSLVAVRPADAREAAVSSPIPEALRPWIPWALHGHLQQLCPTLMGETTPTCVWSGRLSLNLDTHGGHFSQAWEVVVEQAVPLPGSAAHWPLDLKVDGKATVATADGDGSPRVHLQPGAHTVSGSFFWKRLPESLAVPTTTSLIALTLRDRPVDLPARSEDGAVFLQKEEGETTAREEDRLDISVHRRLTDDVPALLTTRLVLDVAGKPRETVLGRTLPDGFIAQSIDAPLPVRLESDGRLRVQLRPGQWTITLAARSAAPPARVVRPDPGGPWKDGEEVWVFEARPALRVVTVEGVPGIDPAQTTLPDAWKALPAYVMAVGAGLSLVEHRRGDANPAADQLTLERQLWLDFDGGGLTARDQIAGTFRRAWRLGMDPESKLGRVTVAGEDQFITRFPAADGAVGEGVEMRQTNAQVVAESRIPHGPRDIPAVGWQHDFQSVSATLALPPGWRLVYASGADTVSDNWIKGWTLLDLFLVLIVGIGIGKMLGVGTGALALLTLVLTFPEAEAPKWAWLVVLVAEALARALPEGWLRRLAGMVRLGAWVGLAFVTIPFAITHVRVGLHPALAGESVSYAVPGLAFGTAAAPAEPAPEAARASGTLKLLGAKEREEGSGSQAPAQVQNLNRYDPDVMVQTGPGLPSWSGTSVAFGWNGPVERTQRLGLWLLPPWLNLVLAFLRVGLVAALILRLLGGMRGVVARWQLAGTGGAAVLLVTVSLAPMAARADEADPSPDLQQALKRARMLASMGAPGTDPEAATPTADVLEQLRARVTEKPKCDPRCASFGRLALEAAPDRLRLRLEAGAEAAATVPLPGNARHWIPAQVLLDGKPASALTRDDKGTIWIRLPAGGHQLVLEGPLPARNAVQIPFPLRPHVVASTLRGWRIEGLTEEGDIEESLQLTREEAVDKGAAKADASKPGAALAPTSLPPFVTVERSVDLGLRWTARTRVVRQTPIGAAVVLEIPLLPGESVTTPGVHVAKGKVQMNLGAAETELIWASTLAQTDSVVLAAPSEAPAAWAETWNVDAGPIWHVTMAGIPPVQPPPAGPTTQGRVVTFRPWPGERVTLGISRPGGTAGQTLTVDGAELTLRPGIRTTEGALSLRLRSSRGGQHFLALPDDATLEGLTVDGQNQPLRQDGVRVTVPIHPGAQTVALRWREHGGLKTFYRASEVDLGVPGVNASVLIDVPEERWVLSVGGPRLGPAVLFWSVLVVLVLVSAFLGRSTLTPLRPLHWSLLGVGLSQTSVPAAAVVAGCLFALGWRRVRPPTRAWAHDLAQLALATWVVVAVVVLFKGIEQGLLNQPDMRIAGNASTGGSLRWFADRTAGELPQPWIVSVPLLAYRLVMLAWSLWLSLALLRWARWAWACFASGGVWRPLFRRKAPPATPGEAPPPPPAPAL